LPGLKSRAGQTVAYDQHIQAARWLLEVWNLRPFVRI